MAFEIWLAFFAASTALVLIPDQRFCWWFPLRLAKVGEWRCRWLSASPLAISQPCHCRFWASALFSRRQQCCSCGDVDGRGLSDLTRPHLLHEYGKWNSIFRRCRYWVEVCVFDAVLGSLAEMVERDPTADMIDSTIVRAHHCAVGKREDLAKPGRLADRAAAAPPSSTPAATPWADAHHRRQDRSVLGKQRLRRDPFAKNWRPTSRLPCRSNVTAKRRAARRREV